MRKSKVYNPSTLLVETATKEKCPRCHGFGGNCGDENGCYLCNGYGYLWRSTEKTGAVRAIHARLENSQLY